VAVVLTLVQAKHKRNNKKTVQTTKEHSKNNTEHSKYKYTYYQNTHAKQNPHIHTPTHYKTQNPYIHTPTPYKTSYNKHSTR